MANDNNNKKELVSESSDDTAELELITARHQHHATSGPESESDADTSRYAETQNDDEVSIPGLLSQLRRQARIIGRFELETEKLRSRLRGLEVEIEARSELTSKLNAQTRQLRLRLSRGEKNLKSRNELIRSLKAEIRDRHCESEKALARLESDLAEVRCENGRLIEIIGANDTGRARAHLDRQKGRLASDAALARELRAKLERAEHYGDWLRRRLQDQTETAVAAAASRDDAHERLDEQAAELEKLRSDYEASLARIAALTAELEQLQEGHSIELQALREELEVAHVSAADLERTNEQLIESLAHAKASRDATRARRATSEQTDTAGTANLEEELRVLREAALDARQQLTSKNQTIDYLLDELAKRDAFLPDAGPSDDDECSTDAEPVITPGRTVATVRDRVTRLLIGSVEGHELRFPLFKTRLTIGRTAQNDIQLNAPYVSRRHAVIVTDGDTTRVIDWGSKNGVFVNSKRVTEHFLRNTDIVAIGHARFRFEERPMRDA